ncbi:MAG TPA: alpha/beta hydrolase [Mobilitalea sp.]|nr:alpha/beta hydrolase [Mobilitalea sp.]
MLQLICVWLFECLWCISNMVLKPRMLSCDAIYRKESSSGRFNAEVYKAIKKQKFIINSCYGYDVSCELLEPESIPNTNHRNKVVILCHGLGYSSVGSLKYTDMYLKLGFHIVVYDHRNHGLSGKAPTSMGHYEKQDLKKVVDWCYETYGDDCTVITHGESMGAATVLLHLGIDNRVKCAIADCAYSDLKLLLKYQLKQYYHLPKCLIPVESLITYLRAGFWYNDVSPIRVVSKTNTPILFIHGKKDSFVPTFMSKQMYACKQNNKGIYLVAGAKHAESYCVNRKGYERRVKEFIQKTTDVTFS